VFTLPNILKKYNPSLTGFSRGSNLQSTPDDLKGLNAAISGQFSASTYAQAQDLVLKAKSLKSINYTQDWKLITIFIGSNDLCGYCSNKTYYSAQNYVQNLKKGLDYLYNEMPRAFINLVPALNISDVKAFEFENESLVCNELRPFQCPCGFFPNGTAAEKELNTLIEEYTAQAQELVDSGVYDNRNDFTVVFQPFTNGFKLPRLTSGRVDYSYFALDCFHFSPKAVAASTISLWNNILQPVGQKSAIWSLNQKIKCPTSQSPYLFTKANSNKASKRQTEALITFLISLFMIFIVRLL
jgi:phospholipase B1, membrane-associated